MIRVLSSEFGQDLGRYQNAALSEPVVVTRDGSDRTVMISVAEYHRLNKRDRDVLCIQDFTDLDIEAVRLSEPSRKAEDFNGEAIPKGAALSDSVANLVSSLAKLSYSQSTCPLE